MSTYIQEFSSNADVAGEYDNPAIEPLLNDSLVYLAWYGYGSYCGSSFVLYENGGKLFEVNGSHCSCYGLEGQWHPEETSWEALAMRNLTGECDSSGEAQKELQDLVARKLSK